MRLPVILMLAMVETISAASSRLDVIDLPTGFFPEGIALGEEWTVYVGSLGGEKDRWRINACFDKSAFPVLRQC